jgi:hypothetical protein
MHSVICGERCNLWSQINKRQEGLEVWRQVNLFALCLAKTRVVLSFTPVTMLQDSAQAVDFKVDRYFGEGQAEFPHAWIKSKCGLRQFRCRTRTEGSL